MFNVGDYVAIKKQFIRWPDHAVCRRLGYPECGNLFVVVAKSLCNHFGCEEKYGCNEYIRLMSVRTGREFPFHCYGYGEQEGYALELANRVEDGRMEELGIGGLTINERQLERRRR